MDERPWYQELFGDLYLRAWVPYVTSQRTLREVDGIVALLNLPSGARILDLACGAGRIAVPLAQRGYVMTGLDLSSGLLEHAKEEAAKAGVEVRWIHSDMRAIPFQDESDAVINIFTSFGYLETEAEDAEVLRAVHTALKPGGTLLLEFVNRDERDAPLPTSRHRPSR
jgi:ubiquinone/menaquinone biosynthesis C-methylase UbiE